MPLKNIASRDDMDSGVLRQRRDFYAIAIGLLLFNLAGGHLKNDTTLAVLLPIKFEYPAVLFLAAWTGFAYFLWRFWLLAPPAWSGFLQDIGLQAGNRQFLKRIVIEVMGEIKDQAQATSPIAILERESGRFVPGLEVHDGRLKLGVRQIKEGNSQLTAPIARRQDFPDGKRLKCWLAVGRSTWFAILYERSFSDYVLPYLLAVVCVGVQVWRLLADPGFLG